MNSSVSFSLLKGSILHGVFRCACACVCVDVCKYLYFMDRTIILKVYGCYPLLRGQDGLAGIIIRLQGWRQRVRGSILTEINPSCAGSTDSESCTPPSIAEFKNAWSHIVTFSCAVMMWRWIKAYGNFVMPFISFFENVHCWNFEICLRRNDAGYGFWSLI